MQDQRAADQQIRKDRLRRGQKPPEPATKVTANPPKPQIIYPPPPFPWRDLTPPFRLMVIYDVSFPTPDGPIGWAYWRRALAVQKYAPPHWQVDIFQYRDVPWDRCGEYDLIYNIDYTTGSRHQIKGHQPNVHVPICISYNSDGNRRLEYWPTAREQADFLIVNNRHAFDHFKRPQRTCCISNGVDTDVFRYDVPITERAHKAVFAGSTGLRKQKGWPEVLRPLEKIAPEHGFETDFRPVDEISARYVKPTEQTVEWYNSASYVVCASLSEGTPNVISEGVACGCIAVTLPVGNVLEWGVDRENCVLVHERTPEAFLAGLEYAREHRERLSAAGMETIRNGWSYGAPGHRAKWYFALFEKILKRGVDSVDPFDFSDTHWDAI